MTEDYNIKSGEKNIITLNGGINSEKIGIQLISPGSQVFATQTNFLFFTDNKSEKAIHIKSQNNESGIIIENGNKNKISLNGSKGSLLEFQKLQLITSNPSSFIFNENISKEYRNGSQNIISGKGIKYTYKEDKLDFEINMEEGHGNILLNGFQNFISNGNLFYASSNKFIFETKNSKMEVDKNFNLLFDKGDVNLISNKFSLNSPNGIELTVNEDGLSINESIVLKSNHNVKIISSNGNIEFNNENGEKMIFTNGRPNGIFKFIGNRTNSKYHVKVNQIGFESDILNVDFQKDFNINGDGNMNMNIDFLGIKLGDKYDGTSLKLFGEGDFLLNGNKWKSKFSHYDFGNLEINDKITKLKGENLSCIYDDIIIKSTDIILKSKKIELDGAEILIKYGNGQVINLEEDGLKYVLEESMFKILKDEIKIISDGQLGVTIAGEKGGIHLNGEINWINFGDNLLESDLQKKSLTFGNQKWNNLYIGKKTELISENLVIESDKIKRRCGKLLECMEADTSSISWTIGKKLILFSPQKLSFISGDFELEINDNLKIVDNESSFYFGSDLLEVNTKVVKFGDNILVNENEINIFHEKKLQIRGGNIFIGFEEKVEIFGGKIQIGSGNSKISLENNEISLETFGDNEIYNINLSADRNINLKCKNSLDIDSKNYNGIFENFYQIVKGDYNQVFLRNNFIKANIDSLEIGGEKLIFGGLIWENLGFSLEAEKINMKVDDLSLGGSYGNLEIKEEGIELMLNDEHYMKISKNQGIEIATKNNINIISRGSNTIFTKGKLFFGNDFHNITIQNNDLQIVAKESSSIITKQITIGWEQYGKNIGDKIVLIGGEKGKIIISEEMGNWENKNIKLRGENIENYSKNCVNEFSNYKLTGENIWVHGNNSSLFLNESGFSVKTTKARFELADSILEMGEELIYEMHETFLKMGRKSMEINSKDTNWDFNVNIKGEVHLLPSRNLKLESSIGDVEIKCQSGNITLDGIGKKIVIKSDGDMQNKINGNIFTRGNSIEFNVDKEYKNLAREGYWVESGKTITFESESEMIFRQFGKGKMEISSLGKIDIDADEDIKIRSEKYGSLYIDKRGIEINSNLNIEFSSVNNLGKFKVEHAGKGEFTIGKNLDFNIGGKVKYLAEEGIILGTKKSIEMVAKESVKIDSMEFSMKYNEGKYEGKRLIYDIKEQEYDVMNFWIKQSGFGEIKVESEGRMIWRNKIEGHIPNGVEINVEGNSHEDSIFIGSRIGGINIQSKRIKLEGDVIMEKIRPFGRLLVDGDLSVKSIKIGDNLFLENKGLSLINREMFEMRNVDVKIDGNLSANDIKCDRIESKKKVIEIMGDMRSNNVIEANQGVRVKGGSIGDYSLKTREFIKVEMGDEYIWNTGIKIDSKMNDKIGIEINCENAIKTNGRIEVGRIDIIQNDYGLLEEIEDTNKYLEELKVEINEKGDIKMVGKEKINVLDMMMKMMAIIQHQSKKINRLEKKI